MRWAGHVAHVVEHMQNLDRKREGRRALAKPRRRWENNINPYPANVENMVSS